MPVFSPDYLTQVGTVLLEAAGASREEGQVVAASLVEANLTGHDSHGVIRLTQYIGSIKDGNTQPGAAITVSKERAVSAVLDGGWGFGQVAVGRGVVLAAEKAQKSGIAAIAVRRANHIGRLGSYVETLAAAGIIGLVAANMHGLGAIIAPWGGAAPRLGTNPLAIGVPTAAGQPLVLDMTTSVVAEGKVRVKRNRGEEVPQGWLLDADGHPTTDPKTLYAQPRGSILPFGGDAGYKGYGLGVIVDLLGGALSGAGCTGNPSGRSGNGVFILAIHVPHFLAMDSFYRQLDDFVDFVKSAPLAQGFDQIIMPGELEARQRQAHRTEGIYVEGSTWQQIEALAADLKQELPCP